MQITTILLLIGLALALRFSPRGLARRGLVFFASIVCLYWLQPGLPIRGLTYWLPTATLGLVLLIWLLTATPPQRSDRSNWWAGGAALALALLIGLTRYLGGGDWLLAAAPPPVLQTLSGLALVTVGLAGLGFGLRRRESAGWALGAAVLFLIALLVVLKTPALALEAARGLRMLAGQNPALAAGLDVRWLGFSYIVFRLVHLLRDRQDGRLAEVGLLDTVAYVIFFPALLAGPIDRRERFERDFGAGSDPALAEPARRILVGLVKKFAVADTLGLIALSPANAAQVEGAGWMWLVLYVYALQIFFDFSGYTDIAIGLGLLVGVKLPENFAAPYFKPNLTLFWNAWHMSLTLWFRAYFFNPFVRWLRRPAVRLKPVWVLFFSQIATMFLIGLWHGITINFILWGLWHGLGLFLQNRWSEATRGWFAARALPPHSRRGLAVLSTLVTFHYVALGWVFFALPAPQDALRVFQVLLGGP